MEGEEWSVDRQEDIGLAAVVVLNHPEYLIGELETSWQSLKPLQNKVIASAPGASSPSFWIYSRAGKYAGNRDVYFLRSHRPHRPIDYRGIMSQQQFGPAFEPEPIPPVLAFRPSDGTKVESSQATADGPIDVGLGGGALCSFVPQSRTLRFITGSWISWKEGPVIYGCAEYVHSTPELKRGDAYGFPVDWAEDWAETCFTPVVAN